jgi:uncharacterized protein (DUF697 family)
MKSSLKTKILAFMAIPFLVLVVFVSYEITMMIYIDDDYSQFQIIFISSLAGTAFIVALLMIYLGATLHKVDEEIVTKEQ